MSRPRTGALGLAACRETSRTPLRAPQRRRTAVVWDALRGVLEADGRPTGEAAAGGRHRRRHRRLRGPGRRARPPRSPSSTPAPTRWRSWAGGPTRAGSPTGSPAGPGRPRHPARPGARTRRRRGALPRRARDRRRPRPRRCGRSPRCCAPAGCSACWSTSGTPRWSPGRWPASFGQAAGAARRPGRPGGGRPAPVHRRRGRRAARPTGFDDTAMHAVRVFVDLVPSSLVDLEPGAAGSSSSSRRSPTGRSTSPSPPRSTPGHPPLTRRRRPPGLAGAGGDRGLPDRRPRPGVPGLPGPARRHGRLLRLGDAIRDRPDLRDVPVVVGGGHRGVVLSANYLARGTASGPRCR